MSLVGQLLTLSVFTFVSGFAPQPSVQECTKATDFQGQWRWAVYVTSKEQLPLSLRDMRLGEIPQYSLVLDIGQRGENLTGRYGATAHFLAKVEDGSFTTSVNNKAAQFSLESAFGGKVTVKLTLANAELHWKLIMADGEQYFPDEVVLENRRAGSVGSAGFCSSPGESRTNSKGI